MSTKSVEVDASKGIGFSGLLTIAFIVLKLCGVITWSWIWVLAPLWIGFAVLIMAFAGIMLVLGIVRTKNRK
jgi:Flp pilus assembly protein TadB